MSDINCFCCGLPYTQDELEWLADIHDTSDNIAVVEQAADRIEQKLRD